MTRNLAAKRKNDFRAINRRAALVKALFGESTFHDLYEGQENRLSHGAELNMHRSDFTTMQEARELLRYDRYEDEEYGFMFAKKNRHARRANAY